LAEKDSNSAEEGELAEDAHGPQEPLVDCGWFKELCQEGDDGQLRKAEGHNSWTESGSSPQDDVLLLFVR